MLKLRILTAFILIPLVIGGIFYLSPLYFGIITALIILLGAWEWSRLSSLVRLKQRVAYVIVQSLILLLMFFSAYSQWRAIVIFGLVFWFCLAVYLTWARRRVVLPTISIFIRMCSGWLILTLCWVAIQVLHITPIYLLFMLLIIWSADTAAYISGRLWGHHLLAPALSPKKTWEGMIIGIAITFLLGSMLIHLFFKAGNLFLWEIFVLIFVTSLASIAGDLFESQLKRLEGLKDSGHLLPGHGGVLDRIDSLLAAAPVFAGSLIFLGLTL